MEKKEKKEKKGKLNRIKDTHEKDEKDEIRLETTKIRKEWKMEINNVKARSKMWDKARRENT